MSEIALSLEAQRYYRFFPAFIKLEERCLRGGYHVAENLGAFCDSIAGEGGSRKLTDLVVKFYSNINRYGYRLRDFDCDFLPYLDTPTFNDSSSDWNGNVRPWHEWDGEPWEDKVKAICKNESDELRDEKYIQYERQQQRVYLSKALMFDLI